jgi:hypothetical protein
MLCNLKVPHCDDKKLSTFCSILFSSIFGFLKASSTEGVTECRRMLTHDLIPLRFTQDWLKLIQKNVLYTHKLTTVVTHNNKDTAITCVTVVTQQ